MPAIPASTYVWLAAVASVPVIIHLINLLQRRRVKWAAMEFLLASQRKHSTWIRLKELLLMLMRVAAVAAIVLMILPPDIGEGIGKRLGVVTTHHIVLLDDGASMSDRMPDGDIFERRAKAAVAEIALQARKDSGNHRFTLLRASRATAAAGGGAKPDFAGELIDAGFIAESYPDKLAGKRDDAPESKLGDLLDSLKPTESSAGPRECIGSLASLAERREGEDRIVYVVSDFRLKDWEQAGDLKAQLSTAALKSVPIYFVDCAKEQRDNLAVTSLKVKSRTYAAGVPFAMQLEVTNFGPSTSGETTVEFRGDGERAGVVRLPPIRPGETHVNDTMKLHFPTPGEHGIEAVLGADAVAADNRRFVVVDLPEAMPCLLIHEATAAGKPGETVGTTTTNQLAKALAPPGPRASGLQPEPQLPEFLSAATEASLAKYRAIYIVDVSRLEDAAVRNLEAFAKAGGGVVFVVGQNADAEFYNSALYREGAGVFPVPLGGTTPLFRDPQSKSPDIVAGDHPVMGFFREQRNAALNDVTVSRYASVRGDWTAEQAQAQAVRTAATLRNGAPLVVEKPYERGRVAAILTDLLPPQSDWHRNYSFIVVVQEIQTYVGRSDDRGGDARLVGTPLAVSVDAIDSESFNPQLEEIRIRLNPPRAADAVEWLKADSADLKKPVVYGDTARSGFYRIGLFRAKKSDDDPTEEDENRSPDVERLEAFNVDATEGNLVRIDQQELSSKLSGVSLQFRSTDDLTPAKHESPAAMLSTWILYALVGLLLGEQALAYSASYHPSRKEGGK